MSARYCCTAAIALRASAEILMMRCMKICEGKKSLRVRGNITNYYPTNKWDTQLFLVFSSKSAFSILYHLLLFHWFDERMKMSMWLLVQNNFKTSFSRCWFNFPSFSVLQRSLIISLFTSVTEESFSIKTGSRAFSVFPSTLAQKSILIFDWIKSRGMQHARALIADQFSTVPTNFPRFSAAE